MDLKTGYFSFHLEHNAIPDVIKDRLVPFHQNQASHPFCSSQGLMRRRTRCSPPWCLQGLSRLTVQAFFLLKKRQDLDLVLFHLPVVTADSHTGAAAQRCCKKNHIICSFNTYKENSRRIKIYFRKLCLIICNPVVFLCFFVWDWAAVTGEGSLQSQRAVVLKVRRNRRGRKMKAGKFCKFNKKKMCESPGDASGSFPSSSSCSSLFCCKVIWWHTSNAWPTVRTILMAWDWGTYTQRWREKWALKRVAHIMEGRKNDEAQQGDKLSCSERATVYRTFVHRQKEREKEQELN